MAAKLRAKPGGESVPVTLGDFADVPVEGRFDLGFVAFNTFFALLTQDDQVRCFRNAADRLSEGGGFVIETFVPDLSRFTRDQNTETRRVEADWVLMEVVRHDPVTQRVWGQHVVMSEAGTRLYPVAARYAWPSELDLMARLAGLRLRDRWDGWSRASFTGRSGIHVSVYERSEG